MRTSRRIMFALMFGAVAAAPAFGFDGCEFSVFDAAIPVAVPQPGTAAPLKTLGPAVAVPAAANTSRRLQLAARRRRIGHPIAQWKLGRMHARATASRRTTCAHSIISAVSPTPMRKTTRRAAGRVVANAFVALGRYYLKGIPNSKVRSDPDRAREMFSYAASYFGDADANTASPGSISKAPARRGTISATARAGSASPPRKGGIGPRPCSARCFSTATDAAAARPRLDVADAGA